MTTTRTGMSRTSEPVTARRPGGVAWLPPVLVAGGLLVVWYAITYLILDERRRFLMPPPHEVVASFFDVATAVEIWAALGRTAFVALVGLALAIVLGVGWAVTMSLSRWAERSLFPYAVVLQCIPILALVPLIGFWMGFGYPARIVVCTMIALFPMVSNTLFGLQSVENSYLELFRLQQATRKTVLLKLQLPAAMPAMFAGMRISAGLAVVGAIVGDYFFRRGDPGLGALISNFQSRVQTAELFAAIVVSSLLGIAVFLLFGLLSDRAVGQWHRVTRVDA